MNVDKLHVVYLLIKLNEKSFASHILRYSDWLHNTTAVGSSIILANHNTTSVGSKVMYFYRTTRE